MTQNIGAQQQHMRGPKKEEENWRDDPRLQVLVWERLQQLENKAKTDGTQGKRKRSGPYNITDNSIVPSYCKWANEAVLLCPTRNSVPFDDLTQTQFMMGFAKNILYTTDPQMKHHVLVELWELIKLAEATSWNVAHCPGEGIKLFM